MTKKEFVHTRQPSEEMGEQVSDLPHKGGGGRRGDTMGLAGWS